MHAPTKLHTLNHMRAQHITWNLGGTAMVDMTRPLSLPLHLPNLLPQAHAPCPLNA
jgi:hypothetical protein